VVDAEKPTDDRTNVLLIEYQQIQETIRTYLKLLVQLVLVYLALTGVVANYALQTPGINILLILAAVFDVFVGAFGASVMFVGRKQMKGTTNRLRRICNLLEIHYEGSGIVESSVWAIFICYLFVVGAWVSILITRISGGCWVSP
jgi:hypothetical protein